MRSLILATLTALLVASAAFADDASRQHLTLFTTDLGYSSTADQSIWKGGAGLAYRYDLSPRVSASLSVAAEQHQAIITVFSTAINGSPAPLPATSIMKLRTWPVELLTRYSFLTASRWTPFVGAGLRYISAPDVPGASVVIPVIPGTAGGPQFVHSTVFPNTTNAEVLGGLSLRLSPRLALEASLHHTLEKHTNAPFDPQNRTAIGLSWKF